MKFNLRDLLWLIAVVSVAAGWYANSRQAARTIRVQTLKIEQQQAEIAALDAELVRAGRNEQRLRMDLRQRGVPVELFPAP